MRSRIYMHVSVRLFAAVATLHLMRLLYGWPVEIGGWAVPLWVSVAGFVVPGALAVWGFLMLAGRARTA